MIRLARGFSGIPTLSREQDAAWMVAAMTGQLMAYLDRRGDLEIGPRELRANALAAGLSEAEYKLHVSSAGRS